jgi:Beta/Gamma crystallin
MMGMKIGGLPTPIVPSDRHISEPSEPSIFLFEAGFRRVAGPVHGGAMHTLLKSLLAVTGLALAMQAAAQVTFYSGEGFHGRPFTVDQPMRDLDRTNFNDRASSAVVENGRWQVCEDSYFRGRCVVLRPGEYASLGQMGMDRRISSVRPIESYGRIEERREYYGRADDWRYGPYDYRR